MRNTEGIYLFKDADSDIVGATASILCVIHCLITPFIFTAQATAAATCAEISPMWWKMVDFIFLIITFFAVYYTAKSTPLRWLSLILYSLWSVLTLLIINKFYHLIEISHVTIYVLAICMSGLHFYNANYCRCFKNKCNN